MRTRGQTGFVAKGFDDHLHPRDHRGRFTHKKTGGRSSKRSKGGGDCFPTSFYTAQDLEREGKSDVRVVHGRPVFAGEGPGEASDGRFWHAWAEYDGDMPGMTGGEKMRWVVDRSNGHDVTLPADLYYLFGQIERDKVTRYTVKQASEEAVHSKQWGPWDKDKAANGVAKRERDGDGDGFVDDGKPTMRPVSQLNVITAGGKKYKLAAPAGAGLPTVPVIPGWKAEVFHEDWEKMAELMTGKPVSELTDQQVDIFKRTFVTEPYPVYTKTIKGRKYRVEFQNARFTPATYKGEPIPFIDPDGMTVAVKTIEKLAKQWPPPPTEYGGSDFKVSFQHYHPTNTERASVMGGYGSMVVSERLAQYAGSDNALREMTRSGWSPANVINLKSDLAYTLTHEWGHLMDETREGSTIASELPMVSQYATEGKNRSLAFNVENPNDPVPLGIENFAEMFADWNAGHATASEVTKELAKRMGWT